ncbi:GATA transcription factor 26-like isoform X1 [Phalaenopsis equestris]|uniref:GATA transcription factor 26-like isoform X1 n=1 Tax=Phalaenopsis equestris TaxID=78828 RepID=UPI0009E57C68|nr:GATA transcription factor 26-like isoform X1 [Phalaenopsis equestris]
MGKHGPCRHCGVTSTPLWRNGPPDKPVLCNACGSRWRTKGSLANYTPLHAREKNEWEEPKFAKMKSISLKNKETKLLKRKKMCGIVETEYEMRFSELDENYARTFDGNASNRSSSGSAISYSESCAHFGVADGSDWTASAQSNVWDSSIVPVPSKKRSVIHPKPSPVEKLTKDLYSIWHEQQSSNLSGSSEEDLLVEGDIPMGSVEIGHGGVLLRYPSCKVIDEESEASSLPVDNKLSSEAYSRSSSFPVNSESKRTHFSDAGVDKNKKSTFQMSHEHAKREGVSPQNFSMVEDRDSPLRFVDLKDVVSLEVFMEHLTNDEQQRLMKYLPSIDTAKSWESLRNLFTSSLFMESLSYFQQLLQDGVFDLSFGQMSVEECRNLKFVLLNSLKSRWVDHHGTLKDIKHKEPGADGGEKSANFLLHYDLVTTKRTRHIQKGQIQDSKRIMRSPKMAYRSSNTKPPLAKSSVQNPREIQSKELLATADLRGNEGACFSPTSLFTWPPDPSSDLLFTDDSSEQDLLLDVRCSSSFPEAELLHHHPRNEKTSSNSSQAESFAAAEEESLCNFPSSTLRA